MTQEFKYIYTVYACTLNPIENNHRDGPVNHNESYTNIQCVHVQFT